MENGTVLRKYVNKNKGIISILEILGEDTVIKCEEETRMDDLARIFKNFAKNKEYNSIRDIFREDYAKRHNNYDSVRPIDFPVDILKEYKKQIMDSHGITKENYPTCELRYELSEMTKNDKENILKIVNENYKRELPNEHIIALSSFSRNDSIIDRLNIVEGYFVLAFSDLDIGEKLTLYLTTEKLIQLMNYCRELIQLEKSETNFPFYIMNMYENECDNDLLLFLNLIAHVENKELRRTYYEALSGTIKVTAANFAELKHLSTINANGSYVVGYKHLNKDRITDNLINYGEYNAYYDMSTRSRWDEQCEYFSEENKTFKKMVICLDSECSKDVLNYFSVVERAIMHEDIKKYTKNHNTQEILRLIPNMFREGSTDDEIVANYVKVIAKATATKPESKDVKKLDLF